MSGEDQAQRNIQKKAYKCRQTAKETIDNCQCRHAFPMCCRSASCPYTKVSTEPVMTSPRGYLGAGVIWGVRAIKASSENWVDDQFQTPPISLPEHISLFHLPPPGFLLAPMAMTRVPTQPLQLPHKTLLMSRSRVGWPTSQT